MLTLTLLEPWASLVSCGAKLIETRSWRTDYTGPIAIHASKKMTGADLEFAMWEPSVREALPLAAHYALWEANHPKVKDAFPDTRGCVIAIATITRCLPTREALRTHRLWSFVEGELALSPNELRFGDYSPGRYAWVLTDVRKLLTPIPATGALGLWQWEPPAGVL